MERNCFTPWTVCFRSMPAMMLPVKGVTQLWTCSVMRSGMRNLKSTILALTAGAAVLAVTPATAAVITNSTATETPAAATTAPALPLRSQAAASIEETIKVAQRRGGPRFRGPRVRGPRGRWRGRRWRGRGWRWRRGRWVGPVIGAGIAAIIIGSSIEASRRHYSDRWERCDRRYRSFRWSDGTFQPYGGGPRRLCPYLRRY